MKKLWNKNFSILVLGQIISLFGSSIQRFALSLFLLDQTGSASIFGSILALSILPIIVLAPVAGVLADRANKRNVMVFLDFISGGMLIGYSVLLGKGFTGYGLVAVVMLLLSGLSTLYQPSVNASIPYIIKEEQLVQANSIVQQVASLSNFLGPILAGVLYGIGGIKSIVLLNAVSFLVSAVMELFLTIPFEKERTKHSITKVFVEEMKESFYYLKKENPVVLRMVVTSGLYNLFLVPVFSVVAPYIIKIFLGMSSQRYGVAEGVIAFGMILGGILVSIKTEWFHIKRIYLVLYGSSIALVIMGIVIALSNFSIVSEEVAFVLFTLFAMSIMFVLGIANVISMTYTHRETKPEMLGKILAFGSAFATLCVPLGQVVFGNMIDFMQEKVYILIFLSSVATFFVTLIVRWNVKQIVE